MKKIKSEIEQTIVVILAAGKGTRMKREDLCKVCFEIDGVPAINRIIETFKRCRFTRFLVVIGSKSDEVLATVAKEHAHAVFAYQNPQLGTGHAAKIAADALKTMGYEGNVLVTLGDKFIEEAAVEAMMKTFANKQTDMALLTIPKTKATETSGGRVFPDSNGQPVDIIEKVDVGRQQIADELKRKAAKKQQITGGELQKIIDKYISSPKKQAKAVHELIELTKDGTVSNQKLLSVLNLEKYNISINGKRYTASQIEKKCRQVNPSLYIFKTKAFYDGVSRIDNNNAQGEYYLTDIVRHLASVKDSQGQNIYKIQAASVRNANWIQGFNSLDELLRIQDYVTKRKTKS